MFIVLLIYTIFPNFPVISTLIPKIEELRQGIVRLRDMKEKFIIEFNGYAIRNSHPGKQAEKSGIQADLI